MVFKERTGQRILERYGMTETNMITSNPYDGERRAGKVGHPLPRVEIRITNQETAVPNTAGEIGIVEVKGPTSSLVTGICQRRPQKSSVKMVSSSQGT